MVNPNKVKGTAFESSLRDYAHKWRLKAFRPAQAGKGDLGDVHIEGIVTVQAKDHMGSSKKINVAGTVVGGRETKNGHLFFNLDKAYPNQVFTVAVWKKNLVNFSYDPLVEWQGKQITVKGKIADFDGIPTLILEKENAIEIQQEGKMIVIIGGGK